MRKLDITLGLFVSFPGPDDVVAAPASGSLDPMKAKVEAAGVAHWAAGGITPPQTGPGCPAVLASSGRNARSGRATR
jgi:hypothetical protein